jgi:hypothetical protein
LHFALSRRINSTEELEMAQVEAFKSTLKGMEPPQTSKRSLQAMKRIV